MMKKWIAILAAVMMVVCCAAALADEPAEIKEDPAALAMFDSDWVDGNAHIMIFPNEEEWNIQVESEDGKTQWLYTCEYDAEYKRLATIPGAFNQKFLLTLDEDGSVADSTMEYDDGAAVFTLDEDGYLIWQDDKENAGEGRKYEKIGWFVGDWECEGPDGALYTMMCVWDTKETDEEEGLSIHSGYRVNIEKMGTDGVVTYWDYAGSYDPATGILHVYGKKSCQTEENGPIDPLYDNGEAEFSKENNCVIWNDMTEGAGEDLMFESANG